MRNLGRNTTLTTKEIESAATHRPVSEATDGNPLRLYGQWWPLLLGPIAMLLVYVARLTHQEQIVSRHSNESIALILLSIPLAGFLIQAFLFRSGFHLFMASMCAAFFCREWHFPGTSKGIYIALTLLAFWAVRRKQTFVKIIGNGRFKIWLIATFWTYLLSQLIARRVFRYVYLPREAELHIFLEETVETIAHLMMIVVCFIAWKVKLRPTCFFFRYHSNRRREIDRNCGEAT
jgi:hypothetical protein